MLQERREYWVGRSTASPCRVTPDQALVDDWHVVAFSKDLGEGKLVPVRLLGEDLVLWRDRGQAHLWKDLCIHRGARLSKGWVIDGAVVCPYHGWRYNSEGRCVLIPAHPDLAPPERARALRHRVEERYGLVWASIGDPKHDVPPFAEWNEPGFRFFHAGPYPFRANAFRSVENFVDATHFPFVHSGLLGVMSAPDKLDHYEVYKGPEGLRTTPIRFPHQPFGDPRGVPVSSEYIYRCLRPTVACLSKSVRVVDAASPHTSTGNDRFCIFLAAQAVDEVSCVIRLAIAINFAPELTEADVVCRQDVVFAQDREIVESQQPERIPLDLREEMHARSDRLSVEYRRWLQELGITYGTSELAG